LRWAVLLAAVPLYGQGTGRTALAVEVRPECGVSVMTQVPGAGGTETIAFQYKLRTGATGGQGQIVLRLAGAGEGMVEYRATLAGPGLAMAGRVTGASAAAGVVIAEFGAETHTSRAGAGGTVQVTVEGGGSGLRPALAITCR
jgi:hypothetical protein